VMDASTYTAKALVDYYNVFLDQNDLKRAEHVVRVMNEPSRSLGNDNSFVLL
jgi:hypothetical protein